MGKILVVDDEPHLRRILISNLKQEHHEVVEAAGVNDARGALAEEKLFTSRAAAVVPAPPNGR